MSKIIPISLLVLFIYAITSVHGQRNRHSPAILYSSTFKVQPTPAEAYIFEPMAEHSPFSSRARLTPVIDPKSSAELKLFDTQNFVGARRRPPGFVRFQDISVLEHQKQQIQQHHRLPPLRFQDLLDQQKKQHAEPRQKLPPQNEQRQKLPPLTEPRPQIPSQSEQRKNLPQQNEQRPKLPPQNRKYDPTSGKISYEIKVYIPKHHPDELKPRPDKKPAKPLHVSQAYEEAQESQPYGQPFFEGSSKPKIYSADYEPTISYKKPYHDPDDAASYERRPPRGMTYGYEERKPEVYERLLYKPPSAPPMPPTYSEPSYESKAKPEREYRPPMSKYPDPEYYEPKYKPETLAYPQPEMVVSYGQQRSIYEKPKDYSFEKYDKHHGGHQHSKYGKDGEHCNYKSDGPPYGGPTPSMYEPRPHPQPLPPPPEQPAYYPPAPAYPSYQPMYYYYYPQRGYEGPGPMYEPQSASHSLQYYPFPVGPPPHKPQGPPYGYGAYQSY